MNKQQNIICAETEQCDKQNAGSNTGKTYRAIRHDVIRAKQKLNADEVHHPDEKINQIKTVFENTKFDNEPSILELFAGQGNCTKVYKEYGNVTAFDKKYLNTGDSFTEYHRLIADKNKFDFFSTKAAPFPLTYSFSFSVVTIGSSCLLLNGGGSLVNNGGGCEAKHLFNSSTLSAFTHSFIPSFHTKVSFLIFILRSSSIRNGPSCLLF